MKKFIIVLCFMLIGLVGCTKEHPTEKSEPKKTTEEKKQEKTEKQKDEKGTNKETEQRETEIKKENKELEEPSPKKEKKKEEPTNAEPVNAELQGKEIAGELPKNSETKINKQKVDNSQKESDTMDTISETEAEKLVINYLKDAGRTIKEKERIVYDHTEGYNLIVHYYEQRDDHTATINWYEVDGVTGAVIPQF